ncbi:MAG: hypothetical protein IBX55_11660 [Methyloprofundus sp.]|nr:hypothetical protein [Methyloprofundus sp.]
MLSKNPYVIKNCHKIADKAARGIRKGDARYKHIPFDDMVQDACYLILSGRLDTFTSEKGEPSEAHLVAYTKRALENEMKQGVGRNYGSGITLPYKRNDAKSKLPIITSLDESSNELDEGVQELSSPLLNVEAGIVRSGFDSDDIYDEESLLTGPSEEDFRGSLDEPDALKRLVINNVASAPALLSFLILGITPVDLFYDDLKAEFEAKKSGRYKAESVHSILPQLLAEVVMSELAQIDPEGRFSVGQRSIELFKKHFDALIATEKEQDAPFSNRTSVSDWISSISPILLEMGLKEKQVYRYIAWLAAFGDCLRGKIPCISTIKLSRKLPAPCAA